MMKRISLVLLFALVASACWAGTMYEWRDPATGKLRAGDHPPENGIPYWREGEPGRMNPDLPAAPMRKEEQKIQECGVDLYGKIGMPISTFMVYCRDMRKLKENKETITAYGKMETLIYYKYGNSQHEYEYFIFINDKLSSIHK